jgi:formamidopyrimidine-DNA glycosylase
MPELPEVETTLRGIKPHLLGQTVIGVDIRHYQLRWPIPSNLNQLLSQQTIQELSRRGKYLLFTTDTGTLILHLGMSGRLHLLSNMTAPQKHDHVDIRFANHCLRFTDPRRFGALLWTTDVSTHSLLTRIGPEPLTTAFNGEYLWEQARRRKMPVKSFIMDSHVVAGVGNIYATEALFEAQIKPQTAAGKISLIKYQRLVAAIKMILNKAIQQGGTTLKDFMRSDGTPGYFSIELQAYGRGNLPCMRCQRILKFIRIGQRSTVYCANCQG